ncbi:MAG: hypothetical protein CMF67_01220 [Magnetovibrio sp.]|nr:hypothetical protein [Magnetovibrio sp.]
MNFGEYLWGLSVRTAFNSKTTPSTSGRISFKIAITPETVRPHIPVKSISIGEGPNVVSPWGVAEATIITL